jgi:hypothetical protein
LRTALCHRHAIAAHLCNFSGSPTRSCQLRRNSRARSLPKTKAAFSGVIDVLVFVLICAKLMRRSVGHLCMGRRCSGGGSTTTQFRESSAGCGVAYFDAACVCIEISFSLLCVCVADRDIIGGGTRERERTHVFAANNKVPRRGWFA